MDGFRNSKIQLVQFPVLKNVLLSLIHLAATIVITAMPSALDNSDVFVAQSKIGNIISSFCYFLDNEMKSHSVIDVTDGEEVVEVNNNLCLLRLLKDPTAHKSFEVLIFIFILYYLDSICVHKVMEKYFFIVVLLRLCDTSYVCDTSRLCDTSRVLATTRNLYLLHFFRIFSRKSTAKKTSCFGKPARSLDQSRMVER